jgi:hypothetical protein
VLSDSFGAVLADLGFTEKLTVRFSEEVAGEKGDQFGF